MRPRRPLCSAVAETETVGDRWQTLRMTSSDLPSRVVDAEHRGWMLMLGAAGGPPEYMDASDYVAQRSVAPDELAEQHGPLRPVRPPTETDVAELRAAIALAGRKAIYSLAVAIYEARRELEQRRNDLPWPEPMYLAKRQLLAGRPGSWEADRLYNLALWPYPDKVRRIHAEARERMTAVLLRWVSDPEQYTEVAETLAEIVSEHADERGGWAAVADQWLQPGALDREGMYLTYGLLYSLGDQFDPSA